MVAEKTGLQKSPSAHCIDESTELCELVTRTMDMAHEQVARSREIVAKSHQIVSRTRQTLMYSCRIQEGQVRHEPRNPIGVLE